MSTIHLLAPVAGWLAPIGEVPDPVFAEGMMGDGVAIDPLGDIFHAPCDGDVVGVAPTGHSVTLRLANGAELLIHVGIDTVALGGTGFRLLVEEGRAVRAGDPLIDFDMDEVAARATSLITPILVVGDGFRFRAEEPGRAVALGDPIGSVEGDAPPAAATARDPDSFASATIAIPMAHGLHARPSAKIASALKGFDAELTIAAHGRKANARSAVALMSLGLRHGDSASLEAAGADARAALVAVMDLIQAEGAADAAAPSHAPAPAPRRDPAGTPADGLLHGVCASPGLGIGTIVHWTLRDIEVQEHGAGILAERAALDGAIAAVRQDLERSAGGSVAAAHRVLLEDPELVGAAYARIDAGRSAGFAWRQATDDVAEALRATGDPLLAERVDDLRDIERQLLATILGEVDRPAADLPDGAILVADTLLPSQFTALDTSRVAAICTARGGPTSHVAIMASAAGVPMLVAVGSALLDLAPGATVIVDAGAGTLAVAPDAEAVAAATARLGEQRAASAAAAASAQAPCHMADGTRIEIFANLASAAEAGRAVAAGAEGCGLLRTEFLFHDRAAAPTEDEQHVAYAEVVAALDGRPLIIRTLDAGADKPLAYLPMAEEENPSLGQRGIRLSLARPDMLAAQLRALLRAGTSGDIRVMLPMIVDAGELRQVRGVMEAEAQALGLPMLPLGIMVETPAAALLADSLAGEADFLSIGTNDLSQYVLAADRGNPATAAMIDALHPSVLRLIDISAKGAKAKGKWIGICGGVASDPLAAAILIGLGVDELSATPNAVPALKQVVRTLTMAQCRALAERALAAASVQEVRTLAAQAMRA